MINTKPVENATDIVHYRVGDPESKDRLMGLLGSEYTCDVGTGVISDGNSTIHPDRVVVLKVSTGDRSRGLSYTVYTPQRFIDVMSQLYRRNS